MHCIFNTDDVLYILYGWCTLYLVQMVYPRYIRQVYHVLYKYGEKKLMEIKNNNFSYLNVKHGDTVYVSLFAKTPAHSVERESLIPRGG